MAVMVESPRHRILAWTLVVLAFVGRAAADEPADEPLPELTPAQLAAKLREAMGRYDDRGSIRVVFTDTRDTNWRFDTNRGTPRGTEADHGLVPRPGPIRQRRVAMASGVRLDDAELRFDPAAARPMVDRLRRHRTL